MTIKLYEDNGYTDKHIDCGNKTKDNSSTKKISSFQVVLQRNLPGTPDEEEKKGPLQLEAQHIQIIQIVVVFLLVLAV